MSESVSFAHPAATVVLLRDGDEGCEVLLVRRNARLSFHGGAWVFPGGRIDAEDIAAAGGGHDLSRAARWAAAREAREEAGVTVEPSALVLFSRWVTPTNIPKRFDTWFFAAAAGEEEVRVDGGEISTHAWFTPPHALRAHEAGEIDLPPPTYVTLTQLAAGEERGEVLRSLASRPFEYFEPRLHLLAQGACSLYHGDAAYDSDDLGKPGPRHRLWMEGGRWRYEKSESFD